MLFNSYEFLVFLPIVVLVTAIMPRKIRNIWLLIASYYFYMCWNPNYALLMAASTLITYFCGMLVAYGAKKQSLFIKRLALILCVCSNIGILLYFKYANFIICNIDIVLKGLGFEGVSSTLDILLPVGISFYTFQALSYTIDVYQETIAPEKNLVNYALFVSFFPQLVAGPIERSKTLLTQLDNFSCEKFILKWDNVRDGLIMMGWGFFQKLVIADRCSIYVDAVYENWQIYGSFNLIIATILFGFQIYCDFGGYSNIAIGTAKILGVDLMQNFRQPYLAVDIKDFWRRWHISLTTWFTDYIYKPMGGSRKGTIRKYVNIMVVFLVSGIWHGAAWHYIIWGVMHGVYQVVGDIKKNATEKYISSRNGKPNLSKKLRKVVGTFILTDFAWLFFRANNVSDAVGIIRKIFMPGSGTLLVAVDSFGRVNTLVLLLALVVLLVVDILQEKGVNVCYGLYEQELWFRGIVYGLILMSVIIFGVYGASYDAGTFIYFQF